jgi:hypothetical protein
MPAQMLTPWGKNKPFNVPTNDTERHEYFTRYARQVAELEIPWLWPLLDATNARVAVGLGLFAYSIESHPEWTAIPEMEAHLQMLPWREESTTSN